MSSINNLFYKIQNFIMKPRRTEYNSNSILRKIKSYILFGLLISFFSISICFVILILSYIILNGLKHFKIDMLWKPYNSDNPMIGGMGPFIVTTLMLLFLTMIIAMPISLVIGIFITQFCKSSKLVNSIKVLFQILNSVPSIIFGMIGVSIFIIAFRLGHNGFSILAGSLTLFLIITPILVISITEAIEAIPAEMINSSYALGSTKLQTTTKIILPVALKNMVGGIILAISRVVGESAPVYLTIGSSVFMPTGFLSQGRSLVTCIYILFTEGKGQDAQNFIYCLSLVVIFLVLFLNIGAKLAIYYGSRNNNKPRKKIFSFTKLSTIKNNIADMTKTQLNNKKGRAYE